MKFILMDIEGTTTSLSFVKDILFPYSENKMPDFIKNIDLLDNSEDSNISKEQISSIKNILNNLKKEFSEKNNILLENVLIDDISNMLVNFIKKDVKNPFLKELQGYLWEYGYKNNDFKGHIYSDVFLAFEKWKKLGITLGIYSSGSIFAQKLLFKYSDYGDLTPYLTYHFDLSTGGKKEKLSYEKISKEIGLNPNEILFLSDVFEELDSAHQAGFKVCQILRPDVITQDKYKTSKDFMELVF